jgi:FeS assembly SUF system protein
MKNDFIDFNKQPDHIVPEPCTHTLEAVKAAAKSETSLSHEEIELLAESLIKALKSVYDPEIPVDIYELGLIYKVDIDDNRNIDIDMTLTAPGCPVAGEMPIWVQNAVAAIAGVGNVKVNLVFNPPWTIDRMSEEAKLALNIF